MLIPLGDNLQKNSLPVYGIAIIALNVLVFAYEFRLMSEDPTGGDLMEFVHEWGLVPAAFHNGEYHGLMTAMFLHGDLMHIVGNLFILWVFLPSLEAGLTGPGLAALYLMSGMVAGVVQVAFSPADSDIPIIGASGAIFGVIGAYFVVFGPLAKIHILANFGIFTAWRFIRFTMPASAYMFFFIIIDQIDGILAAAESGDNAGIAWYAHAGGFFAGALLMWLQRDYVLSNVRRNKEGELEVGENTQVVDERTEFARKGAVLQKLEIEACQYCGESLADGSKIGDTLIRCGNSACQRLNYATAALPEDPKAKSKKVAAKA